MNGPDGAAVGIDGFVVHVGRAAALVDPGGGRQNVFRVMKASDDSGQKLSQDRVGNNEPGVVLRGPVAALSHGAFEPCQLNLRQGDDRLLDETVFNSRHLRPFDVIALIGCREGAEHPAGGVAFGVQEACGQLVLRGYVGQESTGPIVEDAGATFVKTLVGDDAILQLVATEVTLGGSPIHCLASTSLQPDKLHLRRSPGGLLQGLVRRDIVQRSEALHDPLVLADSRPSSGHRGEDAGKLRASQSAGTGH